MTAHYVYPKKYSEEALNMAIAAVENEGLTMYAATKKFGLNREILKHRFRRKKRGLSPYIVAKKNTFKDEEIEELKDWLRESTERGFIYRKSNLAKSAQFLLNLNPRMNVFKDNLPRLAWCQNFAKTYLDLIPKHSILKRYNFRAWFEMVEKFIDKDELRPILTQPERFFVAEEVRFALNDDTVSVPEITDTPAVADLSAISTFTTSPNTITVLLNFSATCCGLPPMIIYPFQSLSSDITESVPESWQAVGNSTGLLEADTFYQYISEVFVPYLQQNEVQLPVLLFVDGERTPVTLQMLRLCRDNQIMLFGLFKEAAGMMERCNITASHMLENWQISEHNEANKQQQNNDPNSQTPTRSRPSRRSKTATVTPAIPSTVVCQLPTIAKVVDSFLLETLPNHKIDQEFAACGIFPWKLDSIDVEHFANHRLATAAAKPSNSSTSTPNKNNSRTNPTSSSSTVRFVQPSPIDNEKSMNYTKMCEVIGESFIEKIDSTTSSVIDIGDENMQIMRKLRQYFGVYQAPIRKPLVPPAATKVRQVRKKRKTSKRTTTTTKRRGRKSRIEEEEDEEEEEEEEDEEEVEKEIDDDDGENENREDAASSDTVTSTTNTTPATKANENESEQNPNKRRRKPCLKYRDSY